MSSDHIRFVCESCRAQYSIDEKKVGAKGVKVRCRKCGYFVHVKRTNNGAADLKSSDSKAPVALSNDVDEAIATQVMQTPLGVNYSEPSMLGELTNPGGVTIDSVETPTTPAMMAASPSQMPEFTLAGNNDPANSFLGADDDEIGAVFDQVLRTGPNPVPTEKPNNDFDDDDDHVSTRVIDGENLRKLALAAGPNQTSQSAMSLAAVAPKIEDVPLTDWFVAINEKQTGPLTLDQIKTHWDTGEISPDSLCWRSGYSDWLPLSEVKPLASVLAPKPAKPVMIAPAPLPAVMSVSVQSAFSAGGMVQTVQSEMQVPLGSIPSGKIADVEHTGTWRPSAASAFASLVKEEMAAIAKPAAPAPKIDDLPGLLDLPREERAPEAVHSPVVMQRAESPAFSAQPQIQMSPQSAAPANPYLANQGATFSAPAVSQYRPQSNKGLLIGAIAAGAVLLVSLIGVLIWLALRPQQPVYVQQPPAPVAVPVQVAAVVPPVAVANPVVAPVAVVAPAQPVQPVVAAVVPPVEQAAPVQPAQPVEVAAKPVVPKNTPRKEVKSTVVAKADPPPKAETKTVEKSSSGDSFEDAFGPAKKETKPVEVAAKKKEVYVPPPPGGANSDLKDSLEQSDKMEVVLSSKPALAKCAAEQRSKEPGVSGKLVMRWQIQTSGRVTNVNCTTDEFKSTYMASCVGGVIKSMSFPKHKKQGEPMELPFKF